MYRYNGPPKIFLNYLDGATETTLVAEPGNVYHIIPTNGQPVVPTGYDGYFELVENAPDDKPPVVEVPPTPVSDEQHALDTMTGESGVNHTESDGE